MTDVQVPQDGFYYTQPEPPKNIGEIDLKMGGIISKTSLCSRGALEVRYTPDTLEKSIFSHWLLRAPEIS
jgi:hypothetical protein